MPDGWICEREGCGHNRSMHRLEWNKFRGEWDSSCRSEDWGRTGREKCRCGEFISPDADAKKALEAARAHMVCPPPCGHHVDEHYWSASGQIQGVCHVSTHGDYPTCGCREYAGPEESELSDAQ